MKKGNSKRTLAFVCAFVLAFCDAGVVLAENNVTLPVIQENQDVTEQPDDGVVETPDDSEHTHVYVETVTKEPTYTEAGEKTFICECGESYTEKIDVLKIKNPTFEKVECTAEGIKLSWNDIEGATHYKIFRGYLPDYYDEYEEIAVINAPETFYVDKNVQPGYIYCYIIRSYNEVSESTHNSENVIKFLSQPVLEGQLTDRGVELSWESVKGATYYNVERYDSNALWKVIATIEGTAYTDSQLLRDENYSYRVRAIYEDEEFTFVGAYSEEAAACWEKLEAPLSFKVVNNGYTQVKLTWNTALGAEGYQIYRSRTNKKGSYVKVASVEGNQYIDKNLKTNTKYYYKIRSYVGDEVSAFTVVKYATPKVIKPGIKQTTTATSNSITVSWKKSTGAHGYYVYRKKGEGDWKRIATLKDPDTTSYTDAGISGRYFYSLRAYKKVNGTTYTSFRTDAVEGSVLGKVTLSSVEQKGSQCAVTVKWKKVNNATGYQVYKKVGKNGSWKLAKTTGKDARTYSCDIPQGTFTYWKVRAIRDLGNSRSNGKFSESETFIFSNPKFNFMADERWKESVDEVTLTIQNTSNATMRFYSENAMILDPWDDELYWYLDMVNSNGEKINYCDVKAGQTRTLTFRVQGGNAEYYSTNQICVMFRFDGLKYLFITDAASTDPELYLIKEE